MFKQLLFAHMSGVVARELKQKAAFASREQEVLLGLRLAAARVVEPWEAFLKANADLTPNQYNVLRILRGSHPTRLAHREVRERMIARDPDITRVVEVGLTEKGHDLLRALDPHVDRMPKAVLGHLGARKLAQLGQLLEQAIAGLGTFP